MKKAQARKHKREMKKAQARKHKREMKKAQARKHKREMKKAQARLAFLRLACTQMSEVFYGIKERGFTFFTWFMM